MAQTGRQASLQLTAALLLSACGGTPFELIDNAIADASEDGDSMRLQISRDAAATADASNDGGDSASIDGGMTSSFDAADACSAPAWDCRGTRVTAHNICVTYRLVDGGLYTMAEGAPAGCPMCGAACACLASKSICGYLNSNLSHYAGCVDHAPEEAEVTCQE